MAAVAITAVALSGAGGAALAAVSDGGSSDRMGGLGGPPGFGHGPSPSTAQPGLAVPGAPAAPPVQLSSLDLGTAGSDRPHAPRRGLSGVPGELPLATPPPSADNG
jgi:hypothetical protein